MRRNLFAAVAAATLGLSAAPLSAVSATLPASWDGLAHVKAKNVEAAYLLPGADFRGYSKVMLDPTEVAFQKNWQRDYNSQSMDLSRRISDADASDILSKVRTGFEDIFRKAYADAGYEVVTEAGPDVLRVRTAVENLSVSAPDRHTVGRSANFSRDAGHATVILEARDSSSGALLGRAVDSRAAGDTGPLLRNAVTNRADFRQLFERWAKISVNGLAQLKASSPVAPPAQTARK